jgi:hypothetical protein
MNNRITMDNRGIDLLLLTLLAIIITIVAFDFKNVHPLFWWVCGVPIALFTCCVTLEPIITQKEMKFEKAGV